MAATGPEAPPDSLLRGARRLASLAFTLILLMPGTRAQQAPASAESAQQIAARVDRHYNRLRSLRVDFTQQYDGMGMHRREAGTLLLKKPGRMRWTYSQPAGKLFVLDGKYAYFYAQGDTQVQRVPAKQLDDLRSPLRFLLGHTQLARELNNLSITPLGAGYRITGVPKNMERRVASLALDVGADGAIHSMRLEEVDGAVTAFTFAAEQPNVAASDADFVFHAPKNIPIVEGLPPV